MISAAPISDELAARVPGDSPDRRDFRRRGISRGFEEGRSSAVDGRCSMVEGWPMIGPSLGPQRCTYDEPERSHRTQRREKESRETGHFFRFDLGLARFLSVASVAHRVFASHGTDHRNGVSFDQQDGSAIGGCTGYDVIGAYAGVARHVAKSAESDRTRNLAWQSLERTGRPGVRAC